LARDHAPVVNLRLQDAVAAYIQTGQGPQRRREPLTLVRDVMSHGALSVAPSMRVNDAWQTLAEHHVAQAPVVDELGRVVGLLLRADMAPLDLLPEPGAVKEAIELARRPVSEVMLTPVPAVAADTPLRRVAGVLLSTGLPGLPVTDEAGVLAGFISRTDILRAVAADPPLDLWSGPAPDSH
jgi:CBS-domain-containing membrane protein